MTLPVHKDRLRPDQRYQTVRNFGASDCWSFQKLGTWPESKREEIARLLFSRTDGIGLSAWRFNLGGGWEERITHPWRSTESFEVAKGQYDWTRQKDAQWFLRAAKRHGVEQFIAFANTPPKRLTRNGSTACDKNDDPTNLMEGGETEYAIYLVDILEHFATTPNEAERIHFDYISPVNEPNHAWDHFGQEGNRADNETIKRIVKALHRELKKRGLTTKILAPEAASPHSLLSPKEQYGATYNDSINVFCNDPEMAACVDKTLAYHAYWSENQHTQLIQDRVAIQKRMEAHPDWEMQVTEYCVMAGPHSPSVEEAGHGRDLGMMTALWVARTMHYDLTLVNVTAWQWWTALSRENYKDGLLYTDFTQPGDPENIIQPKLLHAFGNFSKFVRPGAVRIGLEGPAHDKNGLLGSAYLNNEGRQLVVVYVNMADTAMRVQLDTGNLPVQPFTPYVTSYKHKDNLNAYPTVNAGDPFELPALSVTTLVGEM